MKLTLARGVGALLLMSLPLSLVSLIAQGAAPAAPAATPADQLAALKRSLAESQTRIRQYEWVETTVISLKGEEKARTQKRVYYGADGKLQKVDVSAPAPAAAAPSGGRGGRGGRLKEKVVENKKDDMKEYMEKAAALVQTYVPPTPEKVQAAKDAGKMTVKPLDGGKGVRLEFKDYQLPGDLLAANLDPAAARLLAVNVSTYLEKKDDAVVLNVTFGALQDGTSYTTQTALDAKAKNIRVVIQNSGHRKMAQ